ncbi:hypothetical protein [Candidatus Poriferisodalis sp.]|uniref:hypothetical protein n=1 Tax=Candidatus Poriferisodalis sp. TaxID=3101277 RepID=UPI003B013D71
MSDHHDPGISLMSDAAAEARRHVWDRVDPDACESCRDAPERFLSHVYELTEQMLSSSTDAWGSWGNPEDGYPLFEAIHAAVRVMHQLPRPLYDAPGNTGPQNTPLGGAAVDHLFTLMSQRASEEGFPDSWDWWISEQRTADESREWLVAGYESVPPSPCRQRSGEVFLLGAGFSRALSDAMPTMPALLSALRFTANDEDWPLARRFGLAEAVDFESWLDSLASPQPYRSDAENTEAAAMFQRVADWVGRYIAEVERESFQVGLPALVFDLLKLWQSNLATVITLNYDTIIERCVEARPDHIGLGGAGVLVANAIRAAPLTPTSEYSGTMRIGDGTLPAAFRLAKLHGSIDWQFPGESGRGQPIYAIDTDHDDETKGRIAHLVPYIIPPCFAKVPLFDHEIIRENWHVARRGLERADKLVVMGYSLPPADTAVVQMLRTYAPKDITLLDINRDLKKHYENTLGASVTMPESETPIWDWTTTATAGP